MVICPCALSDVFLSPKLSLIYNSQILEVEGLAHLPVKHMRRNINYLVYSHINYSKTQMVSGRCIYANSNICSNLNPSMYAQHVYACA